MSQRRNYNEPGHAHELTFSCYQRFPLLKSERSCQWFSESLNEARRSCHFSLWAYVIMPEHVHLIIHPLEPQYEMSHIRKMIKEPVARQAVAYLAENSPSWLERLTVKKGARIRRQFWLPGGGYDRNITEPSTLMSMIDYLHLNPVRRGLVERATDWKWSSASWFLHQSTLPIELDRIPPEWVP